MESNNVDILFSNADSREFKFCCVSVAIFCFTIYQSSSAVAEQFSDVAVKHMVEMKDDYKNQVGTKYTGDEPIGNLAKIDCFRYTRQVLIDAFRQLGNTESASEIDRLFEDGGDVAKYLVEELGWVSYFWNPDVRLPADGSSVHPYSAQQAHRQKRHYYRHPGQYPSKFVPVQNFVLNYRPTPKSVFEDMTGTDLSNKNETKKNLIGVEHLKSIDFCYGITNGAVHTFLFSKGDVYEVHWDQYGPTSSDPDERSLEGDNQLYEVSDFYENFSNYEKDGWLSGVLVCPPDSNIPPVELNRYDSGI